MPLLGRPAGPGQGCRRMAIFVQTPRDPVLPWKPRRMPRVLGPGPSPQNQPEPAPRDPVRTTSPLGRTHSAPSMFSLAQPIDIEVGPKPTQPAVLASGALEQPTPGTFRVSPTFMASACTTAPIA